MPPIKRKLTADEATQRLARRMARAEMSPAAALRSLRSWGLSAETSQKVMDYLRHERYLDEERYAKAYVHDKLIFQRWGRLKLRAGLQREGIDDTIIDKTLGTIGQEQYRAILRGLLREKEQTTDAENLKDLRFRLLRFAASRGFEAELSYDVLDEIL